MAGRIRWRNTDKSELKRVVRNFNAKRNRLIKKGYSADSLPEPVTAGKIMQTIGSRRDLNLTLNRLKRFGRKGAEKLVTTGNGVTITKYELDEANRALRLVNARRKKELDNILKTAINPDAIASAKRNPSLQPRKIKITDIKPAFKQDYMERILLQTLDSDDFKRMELYKKNYLNAAESEFGGTPIYDKLKQLIESLSPQTLENAYYAKASLSIRYEYTLEGKNERAELIYREWLDYLANRNGN